MSIGKASIGKSETVGKSSSITETIGRLLLADPLLVRNGDDSGSSRKVSG